MAEISTFLIKSGVKSRSQNLLLVLYLKYLIGINFPGTYFRGDRNHRISRVYIFADSPPKCCKNPQSCLKMTEFSKIPFFAGTNFANFVKNREIREN